MLIDFSKFLECSVVSVWDFMHFQWFLYFVSAVIGIIVLWKKSLKGSSRKNHLKTNTLSDNLSECVNGHPFRASSTSLQKVLSGVYQTRPKLIFAALTWIWLRSSKIFFPKEVSIRNGEIRALTWVESEGNSNLRSSLRLPVKCMEL